MKNIEKIKSGTYKDYLANAISGGLLLGMIFFVLSLIQNDLLTSLYRGFGTSFSIAAVLFVFGYLHEEWYLRRKKIKLLKSARYAGLQKIGLTLNNDLVLSGYIDNFFTRFLTFEKQTKKERETFHAVDIYCRPADFDKLRMLIDKIKEMRDVKNAAWGYDRLSVYWNKETKPPEELIKELIQLLEAHQVVPLQLTDRENT